MTHEKTSIPNNSISGNSIAGNRMKEEKLYKLLKNHVRVLYL